MSLFLKSTIKISCITLLVVVGIVFLFSRDGSSKPADPAHRKADPNAISQVSDEHPVTVCDSADCPEGNSSGKSNALPAQLAFNEFSPLLVANADESQDEK